MSKQAELAEREKNEVSSQFAKSAQNVTDNDKTSFEGGVSQ